MVGLSEVCLPFADSLEPRGPQHELQVESLGLIEAPPLQPDLSPVDASHSFPPVWTMPILIEVMDQVEAEAFRTVPMACR